MKRILLFFVAVACAITAAPLQAKKDGDYVNFRDALERLSPQEVKNLIAKQGTDKAKKNLVSTSNKGRNPIDIAAQAYINLDKGHPNEKQLKQRAQGNVQTIMLELVKNGANILDLEEYKEQDPFLAYVYKILNVPTN